MMYDAYYSKQNRPMYIKLALRYGAEVLYYSSFILRCGVGKYVTRALNLPVYQ